VITDNSAQWKVLRFICTLECVWLSWWVIVLIYSITNSLKKHLFKSLGEYDGYWTSWKQIT
jgi:hypothetical protein